MKQIVSTDPVWIPEQCQQKNVKKKKKKKKVLLVVYFIITVFTLFHTSVKVLADTSDLSLDGYIHTGSK